MTKLWAIVILCPCAIAQSVEGIILDSMTGKGIAGVTVEILQKEKKVYTLSTDAQGHFVVDGVKEGTYGVRYSSREYARSDPGYPSPWIGNPAQAFQVTAGSGVVKLLAHMAPLPRLTGHVVDGRGQAVIQARVQLGEILMGFRTDDQGNFDLRELLPGAYTLWVTPPQGLKPPDPEPDTGRVQNWARTYFPGVTFPEAAAKIVLRPGEVRDIELKLPAVPAHVVRGVLLDVKGTPAPGVVVSQAVGYGAEAFTVSSVETQPDGTFEFPRVVDGEWLLRAATETDEVNYQAGQWIEMTGHDLAGLKLRLSPPFKVQVKVEMPQGALPPKIPTLELIPYVGRSSKETALFMGARRTQVDADGGFSITGVYPGVYTVNGTDPPGYYLDSARVGGSEVITKQKAELTGPVSIAAVYKTNGGTVRGTVKNCALGRVVLVPQGTATSAWPLTLFRSAACDVTGRYEIAGIRPGEFYALAVPGDTPLFGHLFDEALLKQAGSVTVAPGETSTTDLFAVTMR